MNDAGISEQGRFARRIRARLHSRSTGDGAGAPEDGSHEAEDSERIPRDASSAPAAEAAPSAAAAFARLEEERRRERSFRTARGGWRRD